MTTTPSARFAAAELRRTLPTLSPHARALWQASHWDSFPRSYSPEQHAAAAVLLDNPTDPAAIAAVLALGV